MKKKVFYGWYIVALAFVANFMSTGASFYIFNAFMEPLCSARGWDRTGINLGLAMGALCGMFSQLPFGALVMKVGPRVMMLIGPLISGTIFILLGRVESLWQFFLFYILLYVSNASFGGIVAASAVNNWFILKKGKALGISQAGISTSGAILPYAAMLVLLKSDLQTAFLVIGVMIMSIGPFCWLVIRNWPEDLGLVPDGLERARARIVPPGPGVDGPGRRRVVSSRNPWPFARLVRTPAFWKIGLAFALVLIGTVGVMSQLKPRFSDLGFSDAAAMGLMAATAALGAAGKFIWGTLCDRFDSIKVVAALMFATAVGLVLNLLEPTTLTLALFVIIYGFAMGGVMSTYPIIVAQLFGRESFAAVFRFVALFQMLQMLGYIIAGLSRDHFGSYDGAYIVFIVLSILATLLTLTIKRPQA
ncbi:MAG: MFS transporter [Pseudomonadota bacterium]